MSMTLTNLFCALGGFWLSYIIGQALSPRIPNAWEILGVVAFNAFILALYYFINHRK